MGPVHSEPKAQDWVLAWTVYLVIIISLLASVYCVLSLCKCLFLSSPFAGGGVFHFLILAVT